MANPTQPGPQSGQPQQQPKPQQQPPQPQPAQQPPQQTPAAQAPREHIVVAGETIERIADKYGLTTRELRRANDLWARPLRVGEKLTIPVVPYLRSNPPPSERASSKTQ